MIVIWLLLLLFCVCVCVNRKRIRERRFSTVCSFYTYIWNETRGCLAVAVCLWRESYTPGKKLAARKSFWLFFFFFFFLKQYTKCKILTPSTLPGVEFQPCDTIYRNLSHVTYTYFKIKSYPKLNSII